MAVSAMEKDKGYRGGGQNFKPGRKAQGPLGKGATGRHEGANHTDMRNSVLQRECKGLETGPELMCLRHMGRGACGAHGMKMDTEKT